MIQINYSNTTLLNVENHKQVWCSEIDLTMFCTPII